ncbi:MAG TPA: hypothetical protein VFH56_02375 [Acidimicrobiales bacterium]|nr:hypothetical protein [Acidimicrobiales bacterium]
MGLLLAALAATVLLAGCRVDTRVSVVESTGGGGTVAVAVTFDAAAVDALGGQTELAKQLRYADLQSQGWTVSGPTLLRDGGASVSVSHGFSGGAQLSELMAALAGDSASHPFRLRLSHSGGFWTDRTALTGAVDLRCGLNCFGDPGLRTSLGNPLGVSPQPLEGAAGESATRVFSFELALRVPGHVDSSTGNPAVARDGTLTWSAPLGSEVLVGAASQSVDWGHVILAAVLAGLVIVSGGFGGWRVRRRRRHKSAPGDVELVPAPVGEPVAADPGGDLTSWPRV